jgi:cell division transport system permease protein
LLQALKDYNFERFYLASMPVSTKPRRKKQLGSYPAATVMLSITLALTLTGLNILLLLQGNQLSKGIQEQLEMYVYLDRYLPSDKPIRFDSIFASRQYLLRKNGTPQVQFISKELAAQRFMAEAGEDFINFLGENPLRDMYIVRIQAQYLEEDKLREIQRDLEDIPGIFEVTYQASLIRKVQENLTRIALILSAFCLLLIGAIIVMIHNTIRLAMFSQRFLIRSMQLVGATAGFIRRPFLTRAVFQGLLAGMLASLFLYGMLYYANQWLEGISLYSDYLSLSLVFSAICLVGSLLSGVSAWLAVNKYLSLSLDELY